MCRIIDGFPAGEDILIKVFSAASLYYNYSNTNSCFDIENGSDPHGLHGWDWQVETCRNLLSFTHFLNFTLGLHILSYNSILEHRKICMMGNFSAIVLDIPSGNLSIIYFFSSLRHAQRWSCQWLPLMKACFPHPHMTIKNLVTSAWQSMKFDQGPTG